MAAVSDSTVRVEGLGQLVRDLGRLEKGIRKEIRAELKTVAEPVAEAARAIALAKGLRDKGRLVGTTKAFARGSIAGVRTSAKRRGFPYPVVYEYGARGSNRTGPRAYLEPALQRETPQVVEDLGDLLDRLTSANGFGRGGVL